MRSGCQITNSERAMTNCAAPSNIPIQCALPFITRLLVPAYNSTHSCCSHCADVKEQHAPAVQWPWPVYRIVQNFPTNLRDSSQTLQEVLLKHLDAVATIHTQHEHCFAMIPVSLHVRVRVVSAKLPPPNGALGDAYVYRFVQVGSNMFKNVVGFVQGPLRTPETP